MNALKAFAFGVLVWVSSSASAAELALPDCATLNQLWKTRYYSALHVGWPLRNINCARPSAPSYERAFAEAAYVLEHTRFDLALVPAGYEAPPANMLAFVTAKYRLLLIKEGVDYPSTDVARKIVYFYPAVASESGYQVIGNLIHEARHADGNAYLHRVCLDGPNQFKEMCDTGLGDSFSEGGPHRVASLYFAWAAARSDWPKAAKDSVRQVAEWVVRTRINASEAQRNAWIAKYLHDF